MRLLDAASISEAELAAFSRGSYAARANSGVASLVVAAIETASTSTGRCVGAFSAAHHGTLRRGSGGGEVLLPGTLYCGLWLPRHDHLFECNEAQILNRHVRPILRALGRLGAQVQYSGRDWIAAKAPAGRLPLAMASFAHDATSGRTLVEFFIGVHAPASRPGRATFQGKDPTCLDALLGARAKPMTEIRACILQAWEDTLGPLEKVKSDFETAAFSEDPESAEWEATLDCAIGTLGALWDGSSLSWGGDLMISRDVHAALTESFQEVLQTHAARVPELGRSLPTPSLISSDFRGRGLGRERPQLQNASDSPRTLSPTPSLISSDFLEMLDRDLLAALKTCTERSFAHLGVTDLNDIARVVGLAFRAKY
jgi:hypothetical protein